MSSLTLISDDLQNNIAGLNTRVEVLTKRFKAMLPLILVVSVVAVVLSWAATSAAPKVYLTKIEIPENLLSHFKDGEASTAPGLHSEIEGVSEGLFGAMKTMPIVFFIIGFIFIGYKMLLSSDGIEGGSIIKIIFPLIVMGASLPIAGSLLDIDNDDSKSSRETFIAAVDDHNVGLVKGYLKDIGQTSSPAGLYVLAQLSLVKDLDVNDERIKINPDLVSTITADNAGFKPSENVFFALENAAFGEAKSEPAKAFEESSKNKQQVIKAWATAFSAIGIAFGFICGGIFMLREILRRRVNRIQIILNPKTPTA